jgi:hypothetical protein
MKIRLPKWLARILRAGRDAAAEQARREAEERLRREVEKRIPRPPS